MVRGISVIKVRTAEKEVEVEYNFDQSLESMQEFVGGYVESIYLEKDDNGGIVLLCDEEGAMKYNEQFRYIGVDREYLIKGNALLSRFNSEGEFVSLTERDITLYSGRFRFGV